MRIHLMILASLSMAFGAPQDGQYVSDYSGQYADNSNDGRYYPDNSGQYYPDHSGDYRHDGLGNYKDDGTGRYAGEKNPYRDSKYYDRNGPGNLIGSNTNTNPTRFAVVKPIAKKPVISTLNPGYGGQTSATNQIGVVGKRYDDEGRWKILRQVSDLSGDGYHWEYLTENRINAEESGKLYNKGTEAEAIRAQGFFSYTGPDNVNYHITYTADENGFVPHGDHIPTPPPVPEAILKSLAYQRSIGQL